MSGSLEKIKEHLKKAINLCVEVQPSDWFNGVYHGLKYALFLIEFYEKGLKDEA